MNKAIVSKKFELLLEPIVIHQPYLYFYGWELGAYISLLQDYHNDWEIEKRYSPGQEEKTPQISIGFLIRQFGKILYEKDGTEGPLQNLGRYLLVLQKLKKLEILNFYIENDCICFQLNLELLEKKINEYFQLFDLEEV